MQTLRANDDTTPRFEYYPDQSTVMRTVPVESNPFTIGRGDGVDLQINSGCVSREHAVLTKTDGGYGIRDLGSTNGTKVNGRPTTEADLHDGDTVGIAEIELAFACSAVGRLERMATQLISSEPMPPPVAAFSEAIAMNRAVGEALLWQTIPFHRSSIQSLKTGVEFASRVSIAAPLVDQLRALEAHDPCSVGSRLAQLAWYLASEQHADRSELGCLLFLAVHQSCFNEQLLASLDMARSVLTEPQRLGVIVPWQWLTASPLVTKRCGELLSNGISLAFESFDGRAGSVQAIDVAAPSLLILAESVIRGLSKEPLRLQGLEILLATCEASGTRLVIPAGVSSADAAACSRLGIDLVLRSPGIRIAESQPRNEPLFV